VGHRHWDRALAFGEGADVEGLPVLGHAGSRAVRLLPGKYFVVVVIASPSVWNLGRGLDCEARPVANTVAVERDLILGANGADGSSFANVVGGAACAANPSHCDLSRGVETDDIVDAVTFHLVAPDPEFLVQLTDADAVAVPAGTPNHDIGLHPLAATGPYMWASVTSNQATLVRNPYFHEWSRTARPDGYPDRIVFRRAATQAAGLGNYQPSFQQDMLWDQH
jgi:hypothetical protein